MATAPDITRDDLRDLISRGWTPPADALEPFRHLLRPFYDAKGWTASPSAKLDDVDCKNIAGLIATFDHFGIEIPTAAKSDDKIEEAPWVTVLRAYVAEHDGFTTEDATKATGLAIPGAATVVADKLREWGLNHYESAEKGAIVWQKRKAA